MLQCRNGLSGVYLLSAVAVGTALGAVEYFVRTGNQQQRLTGVLTGSANIASSEVVLARFSKSAVEADLGRFRIEHGSREASIRVRDRRMPTPQNMLLESRDQSYLGAMMVRCVDRLHGILGAKACFEGHPIARAMRDLT